MDDIEYDAIVYARLVKHFPGGLTYESLRKRFPLTLRSPLKKSLKRLATKGVIKEINRVYKVCRKLG